jgi:hypothetical protein
MEKNPVKNDNTTESPFNILTEESEFAENAPSQVDLKTPEYDNKFKNAEYYIKKAKIKAEQITQEGLESGAYADRDIRYDEEQGGYVIDTYVMRERTNEDGTVERFAALEDTRPVVPGEWLATNPTQQEGDRANNYAIPDETFKKRYEATDEEGIYRAKGKARIIKNDTGHAVSIDAPWGGAQEGDKNCYFCAVCEDGTEASISQTNRYILSENDFATYVPVNKVESGEN